MNNNGSDDKVRVMYISTALIPSAQHVIVSTLLLKVSLFNRNTVFMYYSINLFVIKTLPADVSSAATANENRSRSENSSSNNNSS